MKTFIRLVILVLILSATPGWAANTWTPFVNGGGGHAVLDGSTAFTLTAQTKVPTTVLLESIVFKPSAANDKIQVRDGGASGAIIWPGNLDTVGGGQVIYYNGLPFKPYIVGTECTLGTPANAVVTFTWRNK